MRRGSSAIVGQQLVAVLRSIRGGGEHEVRGVEGLRRERARRGAEAALEVLPEGRHVRRGHRGAPRAREHGAFDVAPAELHEAGMVPGRGAEQAHVLHLVEREMRRDEPCGLVRVGDEERLEVDVGRQRLAVGPRELPRLGAQLLGLRVREALRALEQLLALRQHAERGGRQQLEADHAPDRRGEVGGAHRVVRRRHDHAPARLDRVPEHRAQRAADGVVRIEDGEAAQAERR